MGPTTIHILLLEDDSVDIQHMERIFREHEPSFRLEIARTGDEALTILRGRDSNAFLRPQIILLDLTLPHMNGLEFLAKLRADPRLKSSIVFVLTGSNSERDKIEAYNLHVAGYFVKPMEARERKEILNYLMDYWQLIELPDQNPVTHTKIKSAFSISIKHGGRY